MMSLIKNYVNIQPGSILVVRDQNNKVINIHDKSTMVSSSKVAEEIKDVKYNQFKLTFSTTDEFSKVTNVIITIKLKVSLNIKDKTKLLNNILHANENLAKDIKGNLARYIGKVIYRSELSEDQVIRFISNIPAYINSGYELTSLKIDFEED